MKSIALWCTLILFAVAAAFAAEDTKKDKDDAEAIQGTWEAVSVEDDGRTLTKEQIRRLTFVFGKDVIGVTFTGESLEWPYTLDPSKKPNKWIDLVYKGVGDPHPMLGIYELDGDSLKLCYAEYHPKREGQRASAFESKKGSANDMFIVFKRKK